MREIKFRAFHKARKKMLEVTNLNFMEKENIQCEYREKPFLFSTISQGEIELMQFTNTYDDDKTGICEGDILFYDTDDGFRIAEIFSDSVFSGFRLYPRISYEFSFEDDEYNDESTIEFVKKYNPEHKNFIIIGNKYENPELLEMVE